MHERNAGDRDQPAARYRVADAQAAGIAAATLRRSQHFGVLSYYLLLQPGRRAGPDSARHHVRRAGDVAHGRLPSVFQYQFDRRLLSHGKDFPVRIDLATSIVARGNIIAAQKQRIGRMIDEIKACRKRLGVEDIVVLGERSHRVAQRNRQEGIPIDPATYNELAELCDELGTPFPLAPAEAST